MRSDIELLDAWQEGEEAAGNELFDRHFKALYRFFRNKIDSGIDDLIQKTFLACIEGRERFKRDSSFRAYMLGAARFILYRECENRQKARARIDYGVTSVHDLQPSPSQQIAKRAEEQLLLDALRRIPIDYQVALELYYWEGLSGREMAEALDLPEPTVRSRIRRGIERLRTEMAEIADSRELLESTTRDLDGWAKAVRELLGPGTP